jgi:hypothetical protein
MGVPVTGYPVVIPDVVTDRLKRYFKIDPADVLNRPAPVFGGKSAIQAVADGDHTWDSVLMYYDDLVRMEFRG